jgi:predicted dehydrogenase
MGQGVFCVLCREEDIVSGERLQAVVVGAGWAGEGHTLALQHNEVHVQAICARDKETIEAVAKRLEVPEGSTDWRTTLETVRPDIVALATPASLRREVVEVATDLGCHILCEKPLAPTGAEAKTLFEIVDRAGIKHAYAATGRYNPHVAWMSELVQQGVIGALHEIDILERQAQPYPAVVPWGWWFSFRAGGGWLNNLAPHTLGMLERVIGKPVVRAMGETRQVRERAPVIEGIHDFRQLLRGEVPPVQDPTALAWREVDTEDAGSMALAFDAPQREVGHVLARDVFGAVVTATSPPAGWYLYGTEGTMAVQWSQGASNVTVQSQPNTSPKAMPVPERLIGAHPRAEGKLGSGEMTNPYTRWAALVQGFLADIEGRSHEPYLTFHDGWRYQEVIDAVRSGEGWREITAPVM